jgi:hypothetical protein
MTCGNACQDKGADQRREGRACHVSSCFAWPRDCVMRLHQIMMCAPHAGQVSPKSNEPASAGA